MENILEKWAPEVNHSCPKVKCKCKCKVKAKVKAKVPIVLVGNKKVGAETAIKQLPFTSRTSVMTPTRSRSWVK